MPLRQKESIGAMCEPLASNFNTDSVAKFATSIKCYIPVCFSDDNFPSLFYHLLQITGKQ